MRVYIAPPPNIIRAALIKALQEVQEVWFLMTNKRHELDSDDFSTKDILEDIEKLKERDKDVAALKDLAIRAHPRELYHLEGMIVRRGGDPGPKHYECGELAVSESGSLRECQNCYEIGYGR